jgi:hypothetical protein
MATEPTVLTPTDNQPAAENQNPETKPQAPSDWRSSLPEDLRGEKMFENIKGKDAAEALPSLAKGYRDAQRLVGGSMGKLPEKGAKPEAIKAWQDANLGKLREAGVIDAPPESADKYTAKLIKNGEPVKGDLAPFYAHAHKLGLTDKQAQGMLDLYSEQSAQLGGSYADTMKALESEYGAATRDQIKLATGAVRQFGGDEVIDVLETTGLGNHPALIKMFAKVGALLAEDDPTFRDTVRSNDGEAKAKKAAIMNDAKHPYWDRDNPGHRAAVEEVQRLNEIIAAQES